MADPISLARPPAGERFDPTAIDATGTTLGDVLTSQSDGTGGKRAGWAAASGGSSSVQVRKNSAGSTFTRPRINLIEGSGVTLTVADDATDTEVDVTIASSGAAVPSWVTNHPDTPPSSPNANDHEYQTGDTIGGTTLGSPGTAPVIQDNALKITGNAPGVSASVVAVVYTAPSTPYTITAKVRLASLPGTFQVAQLILRRNSTGRFQSMTIYRNAADFSTYKIETAKYSALTTRDSIANTIAWTQGFAYLRVTNDGTTGTYQVSETGFPNDWHTVLSEALSTHFTGGNTPDQFGVGIDSFASTARICFIDWLRVT